MGEACSTHDREREREKRNAYRILIRKAEWTKSHGRLGANGKIILEWVLGK